MPDFIVPTYASGTYSIISSTSAMNFVGDYYSRNTTLTGSTVASGYVNVLANIDAGSFNGDRNDQILSKVPVNRATQQS